MVRLDVRRDCNRHFALLKSFYLVFDRFHTARYYEDEDGGIFWSNDAKVTIGEMVRSIGVQELEEEMVRVREFYRKTGVQSRKPRK